MIRALKLWWLRRQVKHLEKAEAEMRLSLQHLQFKVLPKYRNQLNKVMYGTPSVRPASSLHRQGKS